MKKMPVIKTLSSLLQNRACVVKKSTGELQSVLLEDLSV